MEKLVDAATSTPRRIGTKRSSRSLPVRAHVYSYSYDCVGVGVEVDSGDEIDGVEDGTEREDWNDGS